MTQQYFLLFLIIFTIFPAFHSYSWHTSTQLWDLESTTSTAFATEASSWSCTKLVSSAKYSNCGGVYLLGGYNIMGGAGTTGANPSYGQYFYRTYSSLPPHNQINLTYTVYAIDSWDGTTSNDRYDVDIDGTAITGWRFSAFAGYATQLCGGSWADFPPVRAYMTFPHTDLSMVIKFISYLDQGTTDESLGIRDIQLDFVYMSNPATSVCGRSNGTPLPNKACPCSTTNQYMNPPNSGTCFLCESTCATCDGGTANDCLTCYGGTFLQSDSCQACNSACSNCTGPNISQCGACKEGFYLVGTTCYPTCNYPLYNETVTGVNYCETPCPGGFAYWSGNCSGSCDAPLVKSVNNTYSLCNFPCANGEFLYWNSSCKSSCPDPLITDIIEGQKLCEYPCNPSEFLYWNGSCVSSCDFPLSKRTEGTPARNFCDYPCTGNEFLYWNGSCISNCDLPLIQRYDKGKNFCDFLCASTEIMYWDGMCSNTCSSPLILQTQGTAPITREFCMFPCQINQFLYWNGTCSSICPKPLKQVIKNSRMFCQYPCGTSQFLYWNGSCLNSCESPLEKRTENGNNFCDFPCENDTDFLYWNGTCSDSCQFPLSQRLEANKSYCDFPCPATTDFLYWDGSCESICLKPYTSVTEGTSTLRNFCQDHCKNSEYLYWDGTCSTSCDFPLQPNTYKNQLLCEFPCATKTDYLYWNGSCSSSCDFPLIPRKTSLRNFCDFPCSSPDFLYSNGSCISSCKFPLQKRVEPDGSEYCDFPCKDPSDFAFLNGSCTAQCIDPFEVKIDGPSPDFTGFCIFKCPPDQFLGWNNHCIDSCPAPYKILIQQSGNKYCKLPCENSMDYYYPSSGLCSQHCNSPYSILKTQPYLQCIQPSLSESGSSLFNMFLKAPLQRGALTVVTLVKIMQYVRYLDIKMPPRLQRLGISRGRNVLSFSSGMTMWNILENDFVKVPMAEVYERSGLHSSFLVNFWEDFTTILFGILVAGIIWSLERISGKMKWELAKSIFQRLLLIGKWNFVIMVFAINIDDILLFSILEFKTFGASDSSSIFSFLFCLIFFIGLFVFMFGIFYLIRKQRKLRLKSIFPHQYQAIDNEQSLTSFQVIYRGFTHRSLLTELFFLLYMCRIGLPILIVVLFENSPLIVTIFQLLISLTTLTFIIRKRPFLKDINHYQMVLFEIIILLMNLWMLILTIFSINNIQAEALTIILGDLVIVGNDSINLLCLAFLIIKLKIEIDDISAFYRKKSSLTIHERTAWLQVLALPLQQSFMGFEEMIEDYNEAENAVSHMTSQQVKNKYNSRIVVKKKVDGIKIKAAPSLVKFFQNDLINRAKQIIDQKELGSSQTNLMNPESFVFNFSKYPESSVASKQDLEIEESHISKNENIAADSSLNHLDKLANHLSPKLTLYNGSTCWRSDYVGSGLNSPNSNGMALSPTESMGTPSGKGSTGKSIFKFFAKSPDDESIIINEEDVDVQGKASAEEEMIEQE